MEKKNQNDWKELFFQQISTRPHAEKVLLQVVRGIYAIAGIQILIAVLVLILQYDTFVGLAAMADGVIYGLLAFFTGRYQSRASAVILVILAVIAFIGSFMGANVILALLLLWFSVRVLQSVFFLYRSASTSIPS